MGILTTDYGSLLPKKASFYVPTTALSSVRHFLKTELNNFVVYSFSKLICVILCKDNSGPLLILYFYIEHCVTVPSHYGIGCYFCLNPLTQYKVTKSYPYLYLNTET